MMSTKWSGTAAWIKWTLPALFLVSLITWAMGIAFTVKAANHERVDYPGYPSPPSKTILYFYSSALPMATTLAALIDFLLYERNLLLPIVSIIWGIVAFGTWLFMITLWSVCEFSPDTGGSSCPRFDAYDYYSASIYSSGLWYGRLTTGSMAAVLALTQMALGARAVDLQRRERRGLVRKERDDKRSFELENTITS